MAAPVTLTDPQGSSGISKRIEVSQGVTNASGNYTFTFSSPFPTVPHVSVQMFPAPDNESEIHITAVSASSVTLNVFKRTGLTVLGLTLLSLATLPVNACPVSVMAVEK